MSILPPRSPAEREKETSTASIRLPRSLMETLDKIAEDRGYSRNEVITQLLRWGVEELEREIQRATERDRLKEDLEREHGEPDRKRTGRK